ncbi:3-deoxy-D-manno-octulosonate 8-phosphate phosphatase, YrbI family [Oleidesulfovibrio alaskensis G20]|jgi:3-deoxy-D-manno-octulosonate 8-phosphate phosphatase (KDO 8-P phosphatase)|uniref:3-deoxy-D-manno-octulosonate 8-phosphate phosphatase, YrbI family n=1 Tax=Oleidesulfovibrio alaskensis (strain ATCC BAA-1058 / DSM 17464 / G20) TaxID=207559 RepID=Q310T2_OLEA2|nr:HAD-IIIA family hydrolase [Oleidesulfovibrio alaskensis]ABB38564.1 3-deoxy-D-manno-octulosonate 8-phosphate phosphatase, YrbI family [Oleidesulfovibrio alaskensis G20]MBG0774611.1 HAD-IIIA family hydrolase [Oleidesulfovibrio alaskensis]MBL3581580.1 HAD-IIIA family hydrolase [Oleidesulfovibrio alaskensis]MBL3588059.1 HAD-IIIA family hydrolase [bacterium]
MRVKELAANIRLLVLDVDGVLTDGGLYYFGDGRVAKRFNVQDGLGIKMAQSAGLVVAVITGLDSEAVAERVRGLGIEDYHAGFTHKLDVMQGLLEKYALKPEQAAFLGDDWVDLAPLNLVGLPMAVANAQPEVKAVAKYVTTATGGHGAVREAVRFILDAQNKLAPMLREWSS